MDIFNIQAINKRDQEGNDQQRDTTIARKARVCAHKSFIHNQIDAMGPTEDTGLMQ